MNVYLAGSAGVKSRDRMWVRLMDHRLSSYFEFYNCDEIPYPLKLVKRKNKMEHKIDLFLDSGAFSAWTQGIEIDIQEYIKFIKQHQDILHVYANLDVIGLGGKQPNALTAEKTLENQKIMEAAGLNPLPCFHFGEPFSYLEYYVKNYDYLALGVAGNVGSALVPWMDECFSKYICDEKGMPKIKVHGFAVTSLPLMMRYPWYSVDSTSWVVTGRLGSIYVPRLRDGEYIYDENAIKIAVSNRSPNQSEAGKHINTLSPMQKKILEDYIHSKGYWLGHSEFRMESQDYKLQENERWSEKKPADKKAQRQVEKVIEKGISNTYQLRDEMNIIYFMDLEKNMRKWPWAFKLQSMERGLF